MVQEPLVLARCILEDSLAWKVGPSLYWWLLLLLRFIRSRVLWRSDQFIVIHMTFPPSRGYSQFVQKSQREPACKIRSLTGVFKDISYPHIQFIERSHSDLALVT